MKDSLPHIDVPMFFTVLSTASLFSSIEASSILLLSPFCEQEMQKYVVNLHVTWTPNTEKILDFRIGSQIGLIQCSKGDKLELKIRTGTDTHSIGTQHGKYHVCSMQFSVCGKFPDSCKNSIMDASSVKCNKTTTTTAVKHTQKVYSIRGYGAIICARHLVPLTDTAVCRQR